MFGLDGVEANFFTGVMTGIPSTHYATNLVARPYMIIDGKVFYGEAYAKNLYDIACDVRESGYAGLDDDGIEYIKGILKAVETEVDINIDDLYN